MPNNLRSVSHSMFPYILNYKKKRNYKWNVHFHSCPVISGSLMRGGDTMALEVTLCERCQKEMVAVGLVIHMLLLQLWMSQSSQRVSRWCSLWQ